MGGEDINILPTQKKRKHWCQISQWDTSYARLFIVFNSFPSQYDFKSFSHLQQTEKTKAMQAPLDA